jgi:hypothetical protein
MAFLKLTSTNENLSWVLEKNPNTGIVIKSNRQGYLFGFFPKKENEVVQTEYCVYFKDASDEISYKEHVDQSFEYLSSAKYTNARFINDSIQELMLSARENLHTYLERGEDYDVPAHHTIMFNVVATQYKTIDIFQRYFKEVEIVSFEVTKNNFRLVFGTKKEITLSHFLNLVNLFGIFAVLNSNDFTYVHEGMIPKYLKILNRIDAPYFIRYLFKVRLLRERKKFEAKQKDLEQTKLYDLSLTYGDSHDARIDFIKENIELNHSIVDIGTGIDFKYLKIFAPLLAKKDLMYYAIEKDHDAKERIKAGIRNRQLENVELFDSLDEFLLVHPMEKEMLTVICTEVLEHNEIDAAKALIETMIQKINFNQIIITVPNSSFNQYYGLDGAFRHTDHKWEYTQKEFEDLCSPLVVYCAVKTGMTPGTGVQLNYFGVGDKINGDAVSTGLIIKSIN